MINTNKLRGKMIMQGQTATSLSRALGMDRTTFYRRIRCAKSTGLTFTIHEANIIAHTLRLTEKEVIEIFFDQNVA